MINRFGLFCVIVFCFTIFYLILKVLLVIGLKIRKSKNQVEKEEERERESCGCILVIILIWFVSGALLPIVNEWLIRYFE